LIVEAPLAASKEQHMNVSDCVFLVTGGSSGLGGAAAWMAWQAGARVVIADRVAPRDDSPLRASDPRGERWVWQQTDVSDDTEGSAAVYLAQDRFGRLDVLVNAAGIAFAEKIHGREGPHQLASFQKVIQVNLLGSFNMMRLAVPVMLASPPRPGFDAEGQDEARGVVVNTASIAAFDGQIGQVAYAASKGGIAAMTLPAARDLARERIRVMTVAPGVFATPMMTGMPPDVRKALAAGVPNPSRLGKATEYAALVRHIVENDYLNGEVIRLDGALRMAPR
jgi:NAD(P)-dependent dehydrogenase (short-subunit alcohol dehydrogenase family)